MATGYWVYILHCNNDTYYTGFTNHLINRFLAHRNGTSRCKYTRSFKPNSIAQSWYIIGDKALAMKVERYVKKLSRREKEKIIADPTLLDFCSREEI